MASLALLVSFIFLSVLLSGPFSLVFCYLRMPILAAILALFSIPAGVYWCAVAPFPISTIGVFSAVCGVTTLRRI